MKALIFPGGFVYTNNRRALASVTGRVGFTWGPALVYVKGGYAYSDNSESLTFAGLPINFAFDNTHSNGYTVGTGLEYMFAQNWSAKVEYQYYNFGSSQLHCSGRPGAVRQLHQRRPCREGWRELPLQLAGPVAATILIHV